ncbi:NAD(P)/FAD-dependent oxidoreductase [Ciceribacter sp. L1K23]|uniref:NAD(P)/FAD-dependent oxidoreductase n=1 Tax=Ciceribacter sp. L1K23 TaxID=2820276 RepID=UPI001B838FF7|nr:NAD(P)/FAD-dependent oxidoreductase [Ciceribacter sp. L1K23]MBR0557066.1 NAD(P)/FAD-dependent oxidoreductase [Ciceribacter sp. L1K23]
MIDVHNRSEITSPAPNTAESARRRVVIVGGGFGGLACARALGGSDVDVVLIDRRNHNLFQPLLYQVATAALSPADISEPIRQSLARYRNIGVILGEVQDIDVEHQRVVLREGLPVSYDQLVLATGSVYNYFGHETWPSIAPGLKSNREARQIRERLLLTFEKAEITADAAKRKALLTNVIVGGGPTGVEMAGSIAELGQFLIKRDFRNLSRNEFRVLLLEASPDILNGFDVKLVRYARQRLEKMGVEVRTCSPVETMTPTSVVTRDETINTGCIVWGAGVKASPVAQWLGIEAGQGGRVPVEADLRVKAFSNIYVVGDAALLPDDNGKPLPALAQVAKQEGHYLGRMLRHPPTNAPAEPFRFRNRGATAVIGRNAAIFESGNWKLKGFPAWILWAIVHVYLLINFEKRMLVTVQWIWLYLTRQRGARVIDEYGA